MRSTLNIRLITCLVLLLYCVKLRMEMLIMLMRQQPDHRAASSTYFTFLYFRLDLLSILTIVTNKLSDMNIDGGAGKVHKQCPMPQFSLTKKLYFFPENFV